MIKISRFFAVCATLFIMTLSTNSFAESCNSGSTWNGSICAFDQTCNNDSYYRFWRCDINPCGCSAYALCKSGTYWDGNNCAKCLDGYTCPENNTSGSVYPEYTYNGLVSQCTGAAYSIQPDATNCVACPSATDNPGIKYEANKTTGKIRDTQCEIDCPTGTRVYNKNESCTTCTSGYTKYAHQVNYGSFGRCHIGCAEEYIVSVPGGLCTTKCPTGYYGGDTTEEGQTGGCWKTCPAGQYLKSYDAVCTICPPGSYCPGSQGWRFPYSNNIQGLNDCPAGHLYNTDLGKSAATQCQILIPDGQYKAHSSDTGTNCSAGTSKTEHVVNYGSISACDDCTGATWSGAAASSCTNCPSIYTTNTTAKKTAEAQCTVATTIGKYIKTAKDDTQTPCPAGYACASATVSYGNIGTTPLICAASKYSAEGAGTCASCPAGYLADTSLGKISINSCKIQTTDGNYINAANSTAQTPCPAGSACPASLVGYGDVGKILQCTGATWSGAAASSCTNCPALYINDTTNGKTAIAQCKISCAAGATVSSANAACTPCPDGSFNISEMIGYGGTGPICTSCPANSFCPPDGSVNSCSTVGDGTYTLSDAGINNSAMCYKNCALGEFATIMSGRDYFTGVDTCAITSCSVGYSLEGGICKLCAAGTFCDGTGPGKSCSTVGDGTYTLSDVGINNSAMCYKNCALGEFATIMSGRDYFTGVDTCAITSCSVGYSLEGGICKLCAAGTFCDGTGPGKSCSTVGDGTYTLSDVGINNSAMCYKNCALGANATIMSGRDYFTGVDTCAITSCTIGYSLEGGICKLCAAGTFCDGTGPGKSCSTVGDGTYTLSDAGINNSAMCYKNCALGANATIMSGRDYYTGVDTCAITSCSVGYSLEGGICKLCAAGTFCDGTGPGKSCSTVGDGTYTLSDAGITNSAMCYKNCALGEFATIMSGRDYYTGVDTCAITSCSVGYSLEGGICKLCAAGTFCDGTGPGKSCSTVGDGTYTLSDAGINNSAMCYKNCALGANATIMSGRDYFTGVDTCAITSCSVGYSLEGGICKLCPVGDFCDGTGTKSCVSLGDGSWKFTAAGAQNANSCYTVCVDNPISNGTTTAVNATEFYPKTCTFKCTTNDGNPGDLLGNVCMETSCKSSMEIIDGHCANCARPGALTYKPTGNCEVDVCAMGFYPNGQLCIPAVIDCTAPNAESGQKKWDVALKSYGICTIKKCSDGYHIASNACVLDNQVCVIENGTGYKEWNVSQNKWGSCLAESCNPGFTSDASETNELSKPCGVCKNKFGVMGEQAASSYIRGCEIASCMYQGEMYNLEGNECHPICDVGGYSDETGTLKWNAGTKKCDRNCKAGFTTW